MSNTSRARFTCDIAVSVPVGVGAENLDEAADALEFLDGVGHFFVFVVAVAVDEKQVFPCLALAGAGFDAGHVEAVFAERPHHLVQGADLVLDADDEAGAVVFRGGTALAAEHEKPGGIRGAVLDVVVDDLEVVTLGGERPGDGGAGLVLGGLLGGAGGGRGLDDLDRRQVLLHPDAALGQRLRVGVEPPDFRAAIAADEAMLDRHDDLRDDLERAVDEQVERVGDDALGGVLDRHHAIVGPVFLHLVEDVLDGFLRRVAQARAKPANGGLMGVGGLRAEVGHGKGFFQREGARHDLAVDGPHRLLRDWPVVQLGQALEDPPLTVRRIDFLASLELDCADGQRVPRALIQ